MKTLKLTILSLLVSVMMSAQCTPTCNLMTPINGVLQNTAFNGNHCFYSGGAIITNSVNFNNWTDLSFYGDFAINQTINVNNNQTLYLIGDIQINNVTLAGNSKLVVDGDISVNNIISNNGWSNKLYVNGSFTYKNQTYYSGDTIFTANGTGNYLPIFSCNTPLPVYIEFFRINRNGLEWSVPEHVAILQYSVDGSNWKDVSTKSPYTDVKQGFYRLKVDSYYSEVIKFHKPQPVKLLKRIDFYGKETEDVTKPHIEIYSDGTILKVMKL